MDQNFTDLKVYATARAATWADAAPLARTLARAFFNDPLICFLMPDGARREAMLPRLFKLLFKLGLPYGACDVTDGYESAALWRPPHHWRIPIWQYIANGPEFIRLFGVEGAARVMKSMDFIEKRHPSEPHFYLQAIGTDPTKQGKGFGGVIIRHQLANADAMALPAYLESNTETNIPLYERFGFEIAGEINLPGGPTIYPMWRKARPA